MPLIDESGGFRGPNLDGDAGSYGTQDSGEFGTMPADHGLLDDMRDDFRGEARTMGDGYINVGVGSLYQELKKLP